MFVGFVILMVSSLRKHHRVKPLYNTVQYNTVLHAVLAITNLGYYWALCNMGHPCQTHLKHESREISFAHKISLFSPIVLKFCTEHGSDTAVLCAKFQKDWTAESGVKDERNFARFEFKMSFRRMSHVAQCPRPDFELQETPHNISPSRASYGVSAVSILEKRHHIVTGPHCNTLVTSCLVAMLNLLCQHPVILTHLPLDKMAAILADDIFNCIFLNENDRIPNQISLKYVTGSPIDNKPALVQVMACRLFGAKPLPEPMMTQFIDAYMRH